MPLKGYVIQGGELSQSTQDAVDKAGKKVPKQYQYYIAYKNEVRVGGSLAWRANNPGNLRAAPTKIGLVPGKKGTFAVFATMDDGRSAQKDLYAKKYGSMSVKDAIEDLTPRSENNTSQYLKDLKAQGVDLEKDVKSQIDLLMKSAKKNEGMIEGLVIQRTK